jgi:hypothetical protein
VHRTLFSVGLWRRGERRSGAEEEGRRERGGGGFGMEVTKEEKESSRAKGNTRQ